MMVDIHTHVLPGIDDGPRSFEDAAEMVRLAASDGTDTLVATPHRFDGVHPMPRVSELSAALGRLREAVGDCPVRLVLGSELRFTHEIVEHLCVTREAPTINGGSYALVEMPPFDLPTGCERPIYELSSAGIRVVIAHPERNKAVQENPDRFYNFMELGIYGQVDSASLLGRFGKASEATARVLLKCNMAHAIASDGHSPRRRKPMMSAAVEIAGNLIGGEAARALVDANPRAMVEDRPLPHTPEAVPPSSRRRRWFLF